ncbi:MAG: beta-ketoacyl-[acyl-carrier-protein] synthase family protein [Bacteroidales bacterium]|nr:beta-ketoacyl-[acyl-carrier-protein] synthase family protein [Bacteroidales bacterium]
MTKVFVTGMGIISSIGNDINENLLSLRNSKPGIKKPKYFKSKYADSYLFGEVNISTKTLKQQLGLSQEKGLTRTDLFAFKAFNEAVGDAGLSKEEISSFDSALISASTVGGMCLTDQLYEDANIKSESSEYLDSYGCSAHTLRLIEKNKIKGLADTINSACSSSANAIMFGSRLIKSGRVKRAIVGGTDSLAKYTVNGFNALKILSQSACKPFDEHRSGLTLGEGAAYLVLESEDVVANKRSYAQILGYGNANDAFHPSTISDNATGVINAMSGALKSARLNPDKIDYINAHGTGTENNDFVELVGISKIFKEPPQYNSTKPYTGHTLGAAGAIESIFSLFSIVNYELYPGLNFNTPISQFNLLPIIEYKKSMDINYVMSNSFGFGGNCTSIILSKA